MNPFHDPSVRAAGFAAIAAMVSGIAAIHAASPARELPERVTFASADGHTTLVGYVFKPEDPRSVCFAGVERP